MQDENITDDALAALDRGELDIENLKNLITAVGGQAAAAFNIDSNRDGTISTAEYTTFGTGFVLAALGNAATAKAAFPEIKDVKGPEFGELTQHVLDTKFLPNDRAEAEQLVKLIIVTAYLNKVMVDAIIAVSRSKPLVLDLTALIAVTQA